MTQLIPQPNILAKCTGKDAVLHFAAKRADALLDFHRHHLPDLYVAVKRYDAYLKEVIRLLQPAVLADARHRGLRNENINGSMFQLAKYTRIDYSQDTRWQQLQGEINYLLDERKAREQQLKERKVGAQEVDHLTGELHVVPTLPREERYGLRVRL